MLFGVTPFKSKTNHETFEKINKCKLMIPRTTPLSMRISRGIKNLLKKLLNPEPTFRLGYVGGATEIKDHPLFRNIKFQILTPYTFT